MRAASGSPSDSRTTPLTQLVIPANAGFDMEKRKRSFAEVLHDVVNVVVHGHLARPFKAVNLAAFPTGALIVDADHRIPSLLDNLQVKRSSRAPSLAMPGRKRRRASGSRAVREASR